MLTERRAPGYHVPVIPWQKSIGSNRVGTALLLGLILLTMLSFTLPALIKDLPYRLEIDEEDWVPPAVHMAAFGTANPGWFGHPGATMLYPLGALYQVIYDPTFTRNELIWERFKETPTDFIWIGRVLSLAYACAALLLVFLLGRRLGGDRIGLLAAWLFALAPGPLYYATVVRSDGAGTFFALLTLLLCMEYAKKPTIAGALCMGAGAALAIATRFFMAALLPAILLTILSAHGMRSIRTGITHAACAGLATVVIFVLISPFALLDFATLLSDLRHEARTTNIGVDGKSPLGNFLWYVTMAIPTNLTWPTWILALLGLGWIIRKRDARWIPLVTFLCITLLGISLHSLHSFRWIIQILPLFAMGAALALNAAVQRYAVSPVPHRIALLSAALILSIWPFTGNVVRTISMTRPSTFMHAREWILTNVTPGATVVDAVYYIDPFQKTHLRSFLHTAVPHFDSLDTLRTRDSSYAIMDTFLSQAISEQPDNYEQELLYIRALERTRLVASFPASSFVRGPTIHVYDIRN